MSGALPVKPLRRSFDRPGSSIQRLRCGFFFFQAEDGIRDDLVTGVQTCALPISARSKRGWRSRAASKRPWWSRARRSEERRVGKSVDLGGRRIIKKKKKTKKKKNNKITRKKKKKKEDKQK